jgi:hypothetical protein
MHFRGFVKGESLLLPRSGAASLANDDADQDRAKE